MNKLSKILAALFASAFLAGGVALADDNVAKETKREAKAQAKAAEKQAEADYKAAKVKCDELKGNDKDVCLKDAKAAEKKAKADAKAMRDTTSAKAEAGQEHREADYAAAKERCDKLSGDAKDSCVAQAKAKYGK